MDSLPSQDFRDVFRGSEFVPGRIRRIDADQTLEPADGVALEFRKLRGLRGRGLRGRGLRRWQS
jgi:hypothetical protein